GPSTICHAVEREPVDTTSTPLRPANSSPASTSAPAPRAESESDDARESQEGANAFAPVEFYFVNQRASAAARTRRSGRLSLRLIRDPQFLLAVAIALPVLAVEGSYQLALPWLAVAVPFVFIALQLVLTAWRSAPEWLAPARLGLSLGFIVVANAWLDPTGTWPLTALAVPVVALAASRADLGSVAVAVAGMISIMTPLAFPNADPGARQETLALAMAAGVVAFGCQRVVFNLRSSTERVRTANTRERRRARQLAAVESVGSMLAREGPTSETLDQMIGLLERTFGYKYPSIYAWDGRALQLGEQRN